MGLYPPLCIVLYSSLPLVSRGFLLCLEVFVIVVWCRRFVTVYARIAEDDELFGRIYVEEDDALYFLVQGDRFVLESKLKFDQFPDGWWFAGSIAAGIGACLFAEDITQALGISFIHLLFASIAAPFFAASLGLATKVWLVCFHYPARMRAGSGKITYVDLASKC